MSSGISRRDFVTSAAIAGIATTLALEVSPSSANETVSDGNERRRNFDLGWRFSRGDFPSANLPTFADQSWQAVELPHDWSIAGPYSKDEPCGGAGGYLPTGIGWYRKTFTLPSSSAGGRVLVQFDGIYQRSEVWLNGKPLGMRPNGYVSFAYDLTPHLQAAGHANVLAVRVDNSLQPNSRWYSGSGITRHAWLVSAAPVHIALWGVCVRATNVSRQSAALEVTTRVVNDSAQAAACQIEASVYDSRGRRIATALAQAQIPSGSQHSLAQSFQIAQPALWDVSDPQLYSLVASVHAHGHPSDQVTNSFGIRDARFDADRGFLLNGERVKLNGVCLHND